MKKEDFEFAKKIKDTIKEIDDMIKLIESKRYISIAIKGGYEVISGSYYEETSDYKLKEGFLNLLEERKKELEQEFESI